MAPRPLDADTLLAREQVILDAAEAIMRHSGLAGLTVDQVVASVPFSKGTVYGHFGCKEDICLALCFQKAQHLRALFEQAADAELPPCQKLLLVTVCHLLYSLSDPLSFELMASVKTAPAMYQRANVERVSRILLTEQSVVESVASIVNEAVAAGQLSLQGSSAQQVCFLLCSSSFGVISLLRHAHELPGFLGQLSIGRELLHLHTVQLNGLRAPETEPFLLPCSTTLLQQLRRVFPAWMEQLSEQGIDIDRLFDKAGGVDPSFA